MQLYEKPNFSTPEKISGPIFDRIDLKVEVKTLTIDEKFAPVSDGESPKLRIKVQAARDIQLERFNGSDIPFNAAAPGGQVADYCEFTEDAFDEYKKAITDSTLSTRSSDRLVKVARTIADLDYSDKIKSSHIKEASVFLVGGTLKGVFE